MAAVSDVRMGKKLKILLVNPPNCGRSIPEEQYGITSLKRIFKGEPFSLEVLAGPLCEHDVRIFDGKCEPSDTLFDLASSWQPDIVGFTALTCETNTVIRQAATIRNIVPAITVVGGNAATCHPESFNRSEFDYVAIGLAKKSFAELVNCLAAGKSAFGIGGIARVEASKPLSWKPRPYSRKDAMEDVAPRYDLVSQYRSHYYLEQLGLAMGFVVTAYGCTHACSFCTIPGLTGGKYLTQSADSVVRDIRLLGDIPFVRMVDANTFGNKAQAMELCRKIQKAGIRKKYFADVRADTVIRHPDLIAAWKEAGLYAVVVGFEDLAAERLEAYNKKYSGSAVRRAIDILHDLGVVIVGDFIASPDYVEADFQRLEGFIVKNRIEIPVISVLTPMPGTPLYQAKKTDIVITDLDYYTFTNAVTKTALPEDQFYKIYADLVMKLHARPHRPEA